MLTVALTGNAAAGKSTVAELWAGAGVPVVKADDLARDAVGPGSEGLAEVVEAFGTGVLGGDGRLDRAALRDRVFRAPEERALLERILHPRIGALREQWMERQRETGALLVVAEIPLLFEAGLEGGYDVVVCVDAPEDVRLGRLVKDRGLKEDEARRIMGSQIPGEEKRRRAHFVLDNDGSRAELEERSLALLDLLLARARALVRRGNAP